MFSKVLRSLLIVAISCISVACVSGVDPDNVDLYHGFALVDPVEEAVTDNAYLLVRGDRILAVGVGTPPRGRFASRVDLTGHYALPGFIDAHAHITSGPHKVAIRDGTPVITIESVDVITQFSAKVALAFGVTTVRNPGGDPVANARYNENIADGTWIGPEALHAGAVIQPPPFGGSAFAYPRSEAQWQAEARRQAGLGMQYFKLYSGLTETELATGIRVAHQHGLRAIAHLNTVSWTAAARLGIDGLEHALPTSPDLLAGSARVEYLQGLGPDARFMYRWFELADLDGPLIREMVDLLVAHRVAVNLTLNVNDKTYNADNPMLAYPLQERTYMHPENLRALLEFQAVGVMSAEDHVRARAVMPKVLRFARQLHEAGVPMMIGTDGHGGGPLFARELTLHARAGIPVWDVLRLATSDAARIMGIADRTGRIAHGFEADIVFLRKNPVEDIANTREVALVVTNGRARSFEELTSAVDTAAHPRSPPPE